MGPCTNRQAGMTPSILTASTRSIFQWVDAIILWSPLFSSKTIYINYVKHLSSLQVPVHCRYIYSHGPITIDCR